LLMQTAKITIENIGKAMIQQQYQGVFGVDVMVVQQQGRYLLYPLVEINPRWTMGRFALQLKKWVSSQHVALLWLSTDQKELAQNSTEYTLNHGHLIEGNYLLNDLNLIQQTYAFLTIEKKKEIILQEIETILK
jgi:hypothetical protein